MNFYLLEPSQLILAVIALFQTFQGWLSHLGGGAEELLFESSLDAVTIKLYLMVTS